MLLQSSFSRDEDARHASSVLFQNPLYFIRHSSILESSPDASPAVLQCQMR